VVYDKMDRIDKFLKRNPRYNKLSRPLQAAKVCEAARLLGKDAIAFKDGLLTLGVGSSAQAANLQAESQRIIEEINQKLGVELVERIRFRIQ